MGFGIVFPVSKEIREADSASGGIISGDIPEHDIGQIPDTRQFSLSITDHVQNGFITNFSHNLAEPESAFFRIPAMLEVPYREAVLGMHAAEIVVKEILFLAVMSSGFISLHRGERGIQISDEIIVEKSPPSFIGSRILVIEIEKVIGKEVGFHF